MRTPGPGEVAIDVAACGLNFADLLMIEGKYQDMPALPFVPGLEICGRITALGPDVDAFASGDRIAAFCGSGGLAARCVVAAERCLPVPDAMPDSVAAGFLIAYGTSHLALTRRARLAPRETLAVLGAAGGVGLTAVEIGSALGARVIAVARGAEKLSLAKAAGAEVLIDAETPDLLTALKDAGPVDVVYDAVGGSAGEAALRALAPEGRFLVIGFAGGKVPEVKLNHLLVKNIDVIGVYWGGYMSFRPDALKGSLADLMRWYAEGQIRPHISHVLPLEDAEVGLDLLRSRRSTGKVVITP
jgi:NADPH2:quinone reductase